MKNTRHPRYARHRFPAEVISYAVWLYFRFPLSLRMAEEMLAARGIIVSPETVRTTRTTNEAVQVAAASTAFPRRPRPGQQPFPSPPRPRLRQPVPPPPRGRRHLRRG